MSARAKERDGGFTLLEILIGVILMGTLMSAVAMAVVVTLKTSPAVADRADAAVNVQGLVTWLPQDVDSAMPGTFDLAPASTSGCVGAEPGFNVFKMTWREQITSTLDFAVSYRYVPEPVPSDGGKIVRIYCQIGGVRKMHTVTGLIPEWIAGSEPFRVVVNPGGDSARISVEPIVGKTIVIDATTKNLNESLASPPPPPPPATPPPSPTNNPPVAANSTQTVVATTNVAMTVSASDPDGDSLNLALTVIPAGWTVTTAPNLGLVVNAPLTAVGTVGNIAFTVTDTSGATASASVNVTVVAPAAVNQPPSASPSSGATTPGVPVTVALAASDPENAALSTIVTGVPADWTVTTAGVNVTVTPPNTAPSGTTTLNYTVSDPSLATASSTLTITVTGPPPCVVTGPAISPSSVEVKKNNPDSLENEVTVTITIVSGYCVGLSLRYDTGAPNSQYVRTFGDAGTVRSVTLPKHPSPELWTVGTHALQVWDGSNTVIATANLEVTP